MSSAIRKIGSPLETRHEVALRRALAPMLAQAQATAAGIRTPGQAKALGAALRAAWGDAKLRQLMAKAGAKVEAQGSKPWAGLARMDGRTDAAPYDGRALVERWSREAAALISSVRDEVAEGLRADVVAALEAGTDPSTLAARWAAKGLPVKWGTLEGRVKVIAQHQLSILHSRVQRERARALGVTHFLWRTQGDDRVRERHQELDGQRVAYADGAAGEGLPGEPVNCRCWAQSIIPAAIQGPALAPAAPRAGATTPGAQRRAAAVERARERLAGRTAPRERGARARLGTKG